MRPSRTIGRSSALFFAALLAVGVCTVGCRSYSSRCSVSTYRPVRQQLKTQHKYRLIESREETSPGKFQNLHTDPQMREFLYGHQKLQAIMIYQQDVFSDDGIPVAITFSEWGRDSHVNDKSKAECWKTCGWKPYMGSDGSQATVTVSLVDSPTKTAEFSYRYDDEWQISYLTSGGQTPYDANRMYQDCFWRIGKGEPSLEPLREALAYGIAAALVEIEASQSQKKGKDAR